MASIACVDLLEARKYQQFTVHYKCEFMERCCLAWNLHGCGLFGTCGGARACSIQMFVRTCTCMHGCIADMLEATKATGTRLSSYERIFLRSCFCIVLAPVAGAE